MVAVAVPPEIDIDSLLWASVQKGPRERYSIPAGEVLRSM